jgi:hypothetical protein
MPEEIRPFELNSEEAMLLAEAARRQIGELLNLAKGFTEDSQTERELVAKANRLKHLARRLAAFTSEEVITKHPKP